MAQVAEDAAALGRLEVPVVRIDSMARYEPVDHAGAFLGGHGREHAPSKRAQRTIETKADAGIVRARRRRQQAAQLVRADDVGLLDMHRLAGFDGGNGVFRMAGMVRGDVDEVDRRIGQHLLRLGRVVVRPVPFEQRRGAVCVDVHHAP